MLIVLERTCHGQVPYHLFVSAAKRQKTALITILLHCTDLDKDNISLFLPQRSDSAAGRVDNVSEDPSEAGAFELLPSALEHGKKESLLACPSTRLMIVNLAYIYKPVKD